MQKSRQKSRVAVVGAGIGGMATAIRLAKEGFSVSIFEKNAAAGGRCGRIEADGYRFDTGATIFVMPDLYRKGFASFGERLEDHLVLRRVDPTYHLYFDGGLRLDLSPDMESMRRQLDAVEPGAFSAALRYLGEAGRHYDLSVPAMVDRCFPHVWDFINPKYIRLFAQIGSFESHAHYATRFFRDPRLQAAFTFQDMYMGLSPSESPAAYSLLQYSELANGLWYPEGGMYRVAEVLRAIAEKAGVEYHFNSPVERIRTAGGRAEGLELGGGGFLPAEVVLAGPDLGYVYRRLLPETDAGWLNRYEYGCSTVMFYWGLKARLPGLNAHNIFFSGDYHDNFAALKDGRMAADTPDFYVHVPTRVDPAMAPAGCDLLSVAVPVGRLKAEEDQDWPAVQARLRKFVCDRMAAAGYPDLEKLIGVEIKGDPRDWYNRYNLPFGSTHGLSHKLTQMAYLRPHNRHARYRNVYFAGASTHPGTGIPMVLVSARLAAERILAEQGGDR